MTCIIVCVQMYARVHIAAVDPSRGAAVVRPMFAYVMRTSTECNSTWVEDRCTYTNIYMYLYMYVCVCEYKHMPVFFLSPRWNVVVYDELDETVCRTRLRNTRCTLPRELFERRVSRRLCADRLKKITFRETFSLPLCHWPRGEIKALASRCKPNMIVVNWDCSQSVSKYSGK